MNARQVEAHRKGVVNQLERAYQRQYRAYLNTLEGTLHKHGRYRQRTRKYGDYLWHQDREKFLADFQDWFRAGRPGVPKKGDDYPGRPLERMKTRTKKFWIRERHNPQLGTYYVACGQMTKRDAKAYESPGYGINTMHSFDTEEDYNNRLGELKAEGHQVQ